MSSLANAALNKSAIAGKAGKIYPGNFERDMEKNKRQKLAQQSEKREKGETFSEVKSLRPPVKAAQRRIALQGKKATRTTGM